MYPLKSLREERRISPADGSCWRLALVCSYKSDNPFAAAAGAYVLISTQEGPDKQTWHSWVKNLMDWYPWLPDGAIQYGRLRIRDQGSEAISKKHAMRFSKPMAAVCHFSPPAFAGS